MAQVLLGYLSERGVFARRQSSWANDRDSYPKNPWN